MKFIILFFVTFLPCLIFSQNISIKKDSILNDSNKYEIFYLVIDTVGDIENMDYYIKITKKDSFDISKDLFEKTKSSYDLYGKCESDKFNLLKRASQLRKLIEQVNGEDNYRQTIIPIVRKAMAGKYILRYNGQIYRATLLENGVARDAEGALIFTNVPFSSTWTVISFRVGETENVQCYKIRENIWVGDGAKGRMILRKI